MKDKIRKLRWFDWLLLIGVLFFSCILCFVLVPTVPVESPTDVSSQPVETRVVVREGGEGVIAASRCHDYVKQRLVAPATAEFAGSFFFPESASRAEGTNVHTLISYVDAQNGFGVLVRNYYICSVEYLGDSEYRLISLIFE